MLTTKSEWLQDNEARAQHARWHELVANTERIAMQMRDAGRARSANQVESYAQVFEQHAERELDIMCGLRGEQPVAADALQPVAFDNVQLYPAIDQSSKPTNGFSEHSTSASGSTRESVENAPAGCEDTNTATDGGPGPGIAPGERAAALLQHPETLRKLNAQALLVEVETLDVLGKTELLLAWVKLQNVVSQLRDIVEKQLCVIRNEAREPRMQDSARMKLDGVLEMMKGLLT